MPDYHLMVRRRVSAVSNHEAQSVASSFETPLYCTVRDGLASLSLLGCAAPQDEGRELSHPEEIALADFHAIVA